MGMFDWIKPKLQEKKPSYKFDDVDRESSAEIRQKRKEYELMKLERLDLLDKLNMEKKALELKNEIEELKHAFDDEEESIGESDPTMEMIKMFAPALMHKFNGSKSEAPVSVSTDTPTHTTKGYSDLELSTMWANTPQKYKEMAKLASDEQVKQTLRSQLPNADEETIAKAFAIVRQS